jgi:hypothetical protein
MVRTIFKVLAVDIVLLVALFYVLQDLQWRSNFAASLHRACSPPCGYSTSYSYSLLTRFFTMSGNGVGLTSPPTLDWIQVITLVLVAINAWFVYVTLTKQGAKATPAAQP